jgi:hypothetical protein
MDFRKFGAFVLLIGLLIAAYGGIQIATNQPVKAKQSEGGGLTGVLNDMGNAITSMAENTSREHRRSVAVKVIFAGGIIGLLGLGLRVSAKSGT